MQRDRVIVELFLGTGIRLNELVTLDLDDIDLEAREPASGPRAAPRSSSSSTAGSARSCGPTKLREAGRQVASPPSSFRAARRVSAPDRWPDASADEIRKAYKELMRENHPDLNPNGTGAVEKFKQIQEAYAVLRDPEKRVQYDRYGTVSQS